MRSRTGSSFPLVADTTRTLRASQTLSATGTRDTHLTVHGASKVLVSTHEIGAPPVGGAEASAIAHAHAPSGVDHLVGADLLSATRGSARLSASASSSRLPAATSLQLSQKLPSPGFSAHAPFGGPRFRFDENWRVVGPDTSHASVFHRSLRE